MATVSIHKDIVNNIDASNVGGISPNQLRFLLIWNENVTGLDISDIALTSNRAGVQFSEVSLSGEGIAYALLATVSFIVTSSTDTVTVTVAADAVNEGNTETAVTFELNLRQTWDEFLDFASLADIPVDTFKTVDVTDNTVYLGGTTVVSFLRAFDHQGNAVSADNRGGNNFSTGRAQAVTPFGNNRVISVEGTDGADVGGRILKIQDYAENQRFYGAYEPRDNSGGNRLKDIKSLVATDAGILISDGGDSALTDATTTQGVYRLHYEDVLDVAFDRLGGPQAVYETVSLDNGDFTSNAFILTRNPLITAVDDRIYVANDILAAYDSDLNIINDALIFIPDSSTRRDITFHNNYLYYLTTEKLYRIDVRKSRRPQSKQTIYPQFVVEGGALDLTQFVEGADNVVWGTGFRKPAYLSIDSNKALQVASNAVTQDTTLLIKLDGTNDVGATLDGTFEFYLTILQAKDPIWETVTSLSMFTDNTLNLFTLVDSADSITWRSGFTPPPIFTLTDGNLTITGNLTQTTYTVSLTATKGSRSTDITFEIDVLRRSVEVPYSETIRFRTEVAGVDITQDMVGSPSVSKNVDAIRVNQSTVNDCEIILKNGTGYYSSSTPNNFWQTHNLQADGYTASMKLFVDSLVNGTWMPSLLFSGFVLTTTDAVNSATLTLICVDDSYRLRDVSATQIGIPKQAHLYRPDDEDNYEGIYTPETALAPFLPQSARFAISGQTELTLSNIANPSEGPVDRDVIYVTGADARTQGGYRDDAPIVGIQTPLQQKPIAFWIRALANAGHIYNPQVEYLTPTFSERFITNKGALAFESDETRATRTPVDWIDDSTNALVYVLLSNPEAHIQDRLVAYNRALDTFEVIHTFDTGVYVHRLASTDFDTFYFRVTEGGAIDGSRVPKPTQSETFARNYDSAQSDNTKIYRWVRSTGVLTDNFVDSAKAEKPQGGVHYFVGFSNKHLVQEYTGIVPENRSPFEFYSNDLYYRYASDTAFGVARVDTAGTTTALFTETPDDYYNHLNFAFDIQSNGTVYFGYVEGGEFDENTTLTIKSRTAAGVTTKLFEAPLMLHQLTTLGAAGGAYSGVHELLYHNNKLYLVVQIQRVRYEDPNDLTNTDRYRTYYESAGAVLYEMNTTGTPALTVLQTYDFTQFSARSLTVFQGAVHFVENPSYSYRFRPINPDLEGWHESLCYNLLPENDGALKRITSAGVVEDLGGIYHEANAYRGVPMPCLVIDDTLNIVANYAATDDLLRLNSEGAKPDNAQWLVYGDRLEYVLPAPVSATQTVYDALSDLALKTNSLFTVRENVIEFKDREPFRAQTDGTISTTATALTYDGENKAFPTTGYLLIDSEIFQYGNRTATQFLNLTRGVSLSPVVSHADNADILYLDTVIRQSSVNDPYQDITLRSDTARFHNVIQDSNQIFDVRDAVSVAEHGERVFSLDLGLTRHEKTWQEYIAQTYLDSLKEVRYLINIRLRRSSPYLEHGDIVSFYYDGNLLYPMRIVSLGYDADGIQITGRTL